MVVHLAPVGLYEVLHRHTRVRVRVRVRLRVTHLLHATQAGGHRSRNDTSVRETKHVLKCWEVEFDLATRQVDRVAVESLAVVRQGSVVDKRDARVARSKVKKKAGRHDAIVIQPPRQRIDKCAASLRNQLRQTIGVAVGRGVLAFCAGS